jgi:hypothetical protein
MTTDAEDVHALAGGSGVCPRGWMTPAQAGSTCDPKGRMSLKSIGYVGCMWANRWESRLRSDRTSCVTSSTSQPSTSASTDVDRQRWQRLSPPQVVPMQRHRRPSKSRGRSLGAWE